MRGRSHRIPSNDPPDDWGDGSWTVDCVCGVNFDDGEEMVNCDECGVWVHTRCSRFVKGDPSFACDKCKSKKNKNDNEETEVAQLLVELPTKTMRRMGNPYPHPAAPPPPPPPPPRSSFGLWTNKPMEDRVHVQGLPGGDPAIFQGLSSVFTSQLWKCTGYVPKKLNFQYREFPCWDEKQGIDEENENPVDRGADALFSLSKEVLSASPVEMLVGLKGSVDNGSRDIKLSRKEMKRRERNDTSVGPAHKEVKREKIHIRPFGFRLGKRKKEDFRGSKDHSGKKKVASVDKEVDSKKRACAPSIDLRKTDSQKDRGMKSAEINFHEKKKEGKKESGSQAPNTDGFNEATSDCYKPKKDVRAYIHSEADLSKEASGHVLPLETVVSLEKRDCQDPTRIQTAATSGPPLDGVGNLIKQETSSMAVDENTGLDDLDESTSATAKDSRKLKPAVIEIRSASSAAGGIKPAVIEIRSASSAAGGIDSNDTRLISSLQPNTQNVANNLEGDSVFPASPVGSVKMDKGKHLERHQEISVSTYPSEALEVDEKLGGNVDFARESDALSYCSKATVVEGIMSESGEPGKMGQELVVGPFSGEGSSSEMKPGTKKVDKSSKREVVKPSSPTSVSQRKVLLGTGKSSSTSSTGIVSKSDVAGGSKPLGRPGSSNTLGLIHSSKQRVKVNSYSDSKKELTMVDVVKDEGRQEISRKTAGEQSKASANSGLKTSHLSGNSHSSSSKHVLSDSKEAMQNSSSKVSIIQNVATLLGSVESVSALQSQSASDAPNKSPGSGFSPKDERFNPPQQSSKLNHSSMHPPAPVNSSTPLSDEELALLLHQQLNSSPRVPRVPRARHASSMPQVSSPTTTSLLIKRSSSSSGKDNISPVLRRKSKEDASKDGFRKSRELINETKKMDRSLSSPDRRRQDPMPTSDGPSRREAHSPSPEGAYSAKKTWPHASSNSSGPSPSSVVTNQNLRQSPRVNSDDDDAGANNGLATRTLPGLIHEIMSSGRRMTYEELCNAVLPHWQNLRKHNGERYAYSTHSQAVLDCLRNRNEWAQLIDRGPKTNGGGRKRRKLDSEENDHVEGRISKGLDRRNIESRPEDFPKGKRMARKRRRLALQGRGIEDVRKRRKADGSTDDDVCLFSHSSEEGTDNIFSEDDSEGTRTCPVGTEVSPSSDEARSM